LLVEPVRTCLMHPGDVRFYDAGAVHSPKREAPVKLIRIEGQNLDHVRRFGLLAIPSNGACCDPTQSHRWLRKPA
jgi:hypothetical protein